MTEKTAARKPGRPLHSKSADSLAYQEFFVKNEFCIPEKELWVLDQAKENYEHLKDAADLGGAHPYLGTYQNQLKEIANRIYPKLKAVEVTKINPLDGKTPQEKLAALKVYEQVLMDEIKNGNGSSTS